MHLFPGKSTKTAATRAALFGLQYARNRLPAAASPQTPPGELTALPRPLVSGLLLKGGERGGEEEEREGSKEFVLCPRKKKSRRLRKVAYHLVELNILIKISSKQPKSSLLFTFRRLSEAFIRRSWY